MLQELKADIKAKNPGRLYIFHGDEKFLLHHYFDQIKKLLLDELTESFNYHKYNSENFTLQSFVDSVEGFPMMSEHTLIAVDDVGIAYIVHDMVTIFGLDQVNIAGLAVRVNGPIQEVLNIAGSGGDILEQAAVLSRGIIRSWSKFPKSGVEWHT